MVRGVLAMRVVHEYWFLAVAFMIAAVLIHGALSPS
jgi:hypothetical protein